ncbi:MAG: HAMP domain-containing protein, partial [Leptospiraceae bacterium]|nr:HAMP domain-containing protein [Leptospiraceae bacterium]
MRSVVEADPDITYLYTIRVIDGEVVYILDGKELKHSTIWIEEEDFSVVIEFLSEKEARFRVFQNESVNEASVQYDDETLRFRFDPSTKSILVNDQSFLQIESFAPLQVQAPHKLLQTDLLEDLRLSEETLPGTDIDVDVYLGEKGEPAVLPGEPIIDDPQFLEFYKELIRDNRTFISDQYLDGNYGLYMTVMAPILDSNEKSVGLTVIEVYDHKIEQFRRFILIAAIIVTAVGVILPAILIWIFLDRLVLSPVRSLFGTVNQVEDGDYSARSDIKTNDELGSLATGINHMVQAIEDHTAHLEEQVRLRTVDLQKARDRAEALLLNILPAPIAERLKDNEELIVDRFEDASVLFADIVGFTKFSAKRSPDEVVDMLNRLFSEFDAMCERLGLEKIKTIGDAYMCAGGLPIPNTQHPVDAVKAAREMMYWLE